MKEPCYNLFLRVEDNAIAAIGAAVHELDGTEAQKLSYLRSRVNLDCHAATYYELDSPLPWDIYSAMLRVGSHLQILEPIFTHLGAGTEPLMVITSVEHGFPVVKVTADLGPMRLETLEALNPHPWAISDYLMEYVKDGVFDIPRLLDDDHVQSIRRLFNDKKYVSGSKLLMSFIDTIAFVEYGDVQDPITKWLDQYCDLGAVGVSSVELREYRHAILHTSSLLSRKVAAGSVARLVPYVSADTSVRSSPDKAFRYLNLWALFLAVSSGVSQWLATYNGRPEKALQFIARYDAVISDSRMSAFHYDKAAAPGR